MDRILRGARVAMAAALAGSVVLAACVSTPAGPAGAGAPVASLRGSDASTADQAPAVYEQLGKRPGSQQAVARTFVGQPPVIPHATDNFDEVTLTENQCLDCHGAQNHAKRGAPKISDAHMVSATGRKLADSDARRHACQLCHVPQFDARPLVDNQFVGARPAGP